MHFCFSSVLFLFRSRRVRLLFSSNWIMSLCDSTLSSSPRFICPPRHPRSSTYYRIPLPPHYALAVVSVIFSDYRTNSIIMLSLPCPPMYRLMLRTRVAVLWDAQRGA